MTSLLPGELKRIIVFSQTNNCLPPAKQKNNKGRKCRPNLFVLRAAAMLTTFVKRRKYPSGILFLRELYFLVLFAHRFRVERGMRLHYFFLPAWHRIVCVPRKFPGPVRDGETGDRMLFIFPSLFSFSLSFRRGNSLCLRVSRRQLGDRDCQYLEGFFLLFF